MQDFRGLSRQVWHQRYCAQAQWTQHVRQYLFSTINPAPGAPILEIGAGTGAVIAALHSEGFENITGIDIDYPSLAFSKQLTNPFLSTQADGTHLPFHNNIFEVVFCHYLLMWVHHPQDIINEMCRITRPGGWILAMAEPDHQSRIDYPPPLDLLGKSQTTALRNQGVDVQMGRKLRSHFQQAGLDHIQVGIMSAQWDRSSDIVWDQTEWTMIQADLVDLYCEKDLQHYQALDQQARQNAERILFIPTFYALGQVS